MTTHILTKNRFLLKFLELIKSHRPDTSVSLQDDSFNGEYSSSPEPTQALRQIQKDYALERRCFF